MEVINEQTAEGREANQSPPPPADGAASAAPSPSAAAEEGVQAPAREGATKVDREKEIFEALEKGASISESRTTTTPAPPSAKTDQGGRTAPSGADSSSAGATAAPDIAEYGDIHADSFTALKRAKWLHPPEEWQGLPGYARGHLVSGAKQLLAANERRFQEQQQQQRQQAGQAAGAATTNDGLADGANAGGEVGQESQRPGQGVATAGSDDEFEQLASGMVDYFGGDEDVKAKFIEPLRTVMNRNRQQSAQTVLQVRAEIAQTQALEAFDTLAEEIPALKDNEAAQKELLPLAGALFQQYQAAGNLRMHFGKCVLEAARAKFQPNLKQQAQQQLLDRRNATIKGNAGRVGGNANTARAKTKDERDREAFDRMENGAHWREAQTAVAQ